MRSGSSRGLFLLAFLGCSALIGTALYLEQVLGQEPCPLCIIQRIFVLLFGGLALIGALHGPSARGQKVYGAIGCLLALLGLLTAARQVWLQHMPADQVPACLPPLDYMMAALPLQTVVQKVLYGSADCAVVTWQFLGLSIAELSLIAFAVMTLASGWMLLRRHSGLAFAVRG